MELPDFWNYSLKEWHEGTLAYANILKPRSVPDFGTFQFRDWASGRLQLNEIEQGETGHRLERLLRRFQRHLLLREFRNRLRHVEILELR